MEAPTTFSTEFQATFSSDFPLFTDDPLNNFTFAPEDHDLIFTDQTVLLANFEEEIQPSEDQGLFSCASPNTKASFLVFESKKISKETAQSRRRNASGTASPTPRKRSVWSSSEDEQLLDLFNAHGPRWAKIASFMENRTRKQVRDRYLNVLVSNINKAPWTEEEDRVIMNMLKKIGAQWCRISEALNGRTEMQVKNRYYIYLKKYGGKFELEEVSTKENSIRGQSPRAFDPTDMISYDADGGFGGYEMNFSWGDLSLRL